MQRGKVEQKSSFQCFNTYKETNLTLRGLRQSQEKHGELVKWKQVEDQDWENLSIKSFS